MAKDAAKKGKTAPPAAGADDPGSDADGADGADAAAPPAAKSRKKILLIAAPVLLLAIGAGLWFSGILPRLIFGKPPEVIASGPQVRVFVDLPEMVTNLNGTSKRQVYIKLHAKLEVPGKADADAVAAAMPRIQDLFQTYLRDLRPEELKGSIGSYRLREELINRASIAIAPAEVRDVLFIELVIE